MKKIAVVVAMQSEFALVEQHLVNKTTQTAGTRTFVLGTIAQHEVILVRSGIGKVNAAITAMELIHHFSPDAIINTGVAGGIDQSLSVGDIVIAEQSCYHDFYAGEISDHMKELGFPAKHQAHAQLCDTFRSLVAHRQDVHFGLACTGDQFITNNDELMKIKAQHPTALSVDMETNSIAQVCFQNNVPFISFRIISDTPWVTNHTEQYTHFWETVPQRSFALLSEFLEQLPC